MAADAFRRVRQGERATIAADAWNAMLETAEAFRVGQGFAQNGIDVSQSGKIWIRNNTADTLAPFTVVGIGAAVTTPTDDAEEYVANMTFESTAPADGERFAILQEGIEPDTIGEARAFGLTHAYVDMTDAAHAYAAPVDDDYDKLTSQAEPGPAEIYYVESGTGTKLARVMIVRSVTTPTLDIEVYTPTDWVNNTRGVYLVELTASGGNGNDPADVGEDFISGGGGGGAYSASLLTLDPGVYSITEDSGYVYFKNSIGTTLVKAQKGADGSIRTVASGIGTAAGGAGGLAANGIGDLKYDGGDGGQGEIFASTWNGSGGGGGGGGRYAAGVNGDAAIDGDTPSGQGGISGGPVAYQWATLFPGESLQSTGADGLNDGISGYTAYSSFGSGISSGQLGFETTAGSISRFQARIMSQSAIQSSTSGAVGVNIASGTDAAGTVFSQGLATTIGHAIDGGTW